MTTLPRSSQFNFRTPADTLELAKQVSQNHQTSLSNVLNMVIDYMASTGEIPNLTNEVSYEPISSEQFELTADEIFTTYDDLFRKLVDM